MLLDMSGNEELEAVRAAVKVALGRRDWIEVNRLLSSVDPSSLTGPELQLLVEACQAVENDTDRYDRLVETAHTRYLEEGDIEGAAWTALCRVFSAGAAGDEAVLGGWFATAVRLIDGLPECKVQVFAAILMSFPGIEAGDYDAAVDSLAEARELARKLGNRDLELWALEREGIARAKRGEVEQGTAMLDEAMVAALSGNVLPQIVQAIFCHTITLCQEIGDYKRAAQWVDAADRMTGARGIVFSGDCRIHRAGILKLRGSLARAEAEARLGCEGYWFPNNPHGGMGWSEIGEIRLRVGDLEGAEEAFTMAHSRGYPPDPGFALLRMAQGQPALAAQEIDRALEQQVADRSARVWLLNAAVGIRLSTGDLSGAELACAELVELAGVFGADAFTAAAQCSQGAIRSAHGDHPEAAKLVRAGIAGWMGVGAPYEVALARVGLAEILNRAGEPQTARLELQSARIAFRELGAERDEHHASRLLTELEGDAPDPSAGRRVEKTFMFTDIEQSTALSAAMGDEEWDRVLRRHDRLLRDAIRDFDGHVVKHEGDGVFAVFDTPEATVESTVAIQERLAEHRENHGFAPAVRIGIHSGPATERNGDYFGMAVNTTARVMSVAKGGEIVATGALSTACGSRASEPRRVELKGVGEETTIVDIAWRTAGVA